MNMIAGIDNTPIFYGVVENRIDPMKLGRVQVRIMGMHSEIKNGNEETGEGIPTEDLPWAYPMQPITSAAMNGIGDSPTGMVEGTHVIGISRDGRFMNDLIIIGTIGGIPQEASNPQVGFNDPNGTYPKEDYLEEPDTNRLARGEKLSETVYQDKKDSLDENVSKANGIGVWSEPMSPYAAEYPYNHVRESESGHLQEWDDTSGAERIHTYHKTGTFEEIHADGSRVTRIIGDDYEIVNSGKNVHIKGNMNVTINGDASLLINGNVEEQVKKNVNRVVEGNLVEHIKGSSTRTVDGAVVENVGGSKTSTVTGSETNKSNGLDVDGGPTIKYTAGRIDIN